MTPGFAFKTPAPLNGAGGVVEAVVPWLVVPTLRVVAAVVVDGV